ncbi:murein biosynthesis integral membrane protein MurJ [Polynucleobacter sp. Latsch14-2]|jgi:putative peptidoglycan lipid II flippase|uniref:murein biosynthesis integral membrane protein MurJ n=1 Tax=Polynucleobacter sp. Latsch14-2 TaxID=2576920 RepID=UPI001C0D6D4A|nr:murein biosynthesis integral membrane protein MurJ [Polynucleobacter sp. Latsch14-2]MBU3613612.1 murein biosynthesis integral membrane protein MurJ [Polynucleobacter sp. Latsch14-2]
MNLLSAAAKVSSLTMLSRITGLLRETLIARSFGASEWTDAFNVAFRLPNLLRRLFAEGAFSQAFVPILGEISSNGDQKQAQILVNAVATLLFWALLLTVLLGVIGAPLLILVIATGFKGSSTYEASVVMTRIMFPYIGLISMVSLSAGILNTFQRFAIPAFTPVLLNLALIGSAVFLAPHLEQPIYALSIGVLLGGILQLAIQVPALARLGLLPRIGLLPGAIKRAAANPEARRVLKLMGPAVFAVSVAQISLIINTNIASRLPAGSVSWLSYADRLMEFPTALLGVALGTVLLPSLSKANAQNDLKHAGELLVWGLQLTFLLAAPCALTLFIFGEPLAAVLYHYGKFNALDVLMTQRALAAYGVGLIGLILVKILAPGFYSRQDIRTPVKIGLLVLVVTQLANLVFVPWLGHAGLALSIGVGACLNASLLWIGLSKRGALPNASWGKYLGQLCVALIPFGMLLYYAANAHDWIALQINPWIRIGLLACWLSAAAVIYFATLGLVGIRWQKFLRHAK